ncbi:MAG: FGGY-family carbohydrate kinase [Propionicimonas sp.]|uniref:xylulokinase n=1 Tax=Propionicimonas sp. TaxID=1955623 RepID=UPI003D0D2890
MSTFLGLDLGTSATKGVILADDGTVVARARAPHPDSRRGRPGRADPAAWEQSIVAVCLQLAPELAQVDGIGIDTHCPTVVPLGADRRPVSLGVTWDNPALGPLFQRWSERRSPTDIRATGNHPSQSTFAVIAHHYLRETEPDAFSRLVTLGFAGTWLGALLTGELGIDPTQASYSGVFDTIGDQPRWLESALTDLCIDPAVLPPVREPLDVLGATSTTFAELAGIPLGIPVLVGCADTPAASYALGTTPGTNPFLIMGTTHVVNSCLPSPDLRARALQRRGLRPGEWLINGVTNGGDALAAASSAFGFGDRDSAVAELVRLAAGVSGESALGAPFFVPHVMPERGPFWFEEPCSGLTGMTRSTTREQLARGTLDGVILADRMVLEATIPPGDEVVYLTGAFGEDPVLPQLLADATGRSFDVALEPDLPAIGAAAMCAEVVRGPVACRLATSRVAPRPDNAALAERRWAAFREQWSVLTGRDPLPALATTSPSPLVPTRS